MVVPKPEHTVGLRSRQQLEGRVLGSAVASEQCGEAIEELHEVTRLKRGIDTRAWLHDRLVQGTHAALNLMEDDRQIQASHTGGQERFLHFSIVGLDLADVVLESF